MEIALGIGNRVQSVSIPDENIADILLPNDIPFDTTEEAEIKRALAEPIGTPRLREIAKPGKKIAIITSDITRPMPTSKVMPAILDELYEAGVKKEDIILVFALGSHRPHTEDEKRKLAGDRAYEEITCIDSDPDDCVRMGVTGRGTPVDIFRPVAEADIKICLGNIEYHYFAGYSGGGKAIMPGVSTRTAIQSNHSMMVRDEACAGRIDDNPVRADIEEAASICGVDFILNVVLSEHKKIVRAFAGDMIKAHREGCKFIDKMYLKKISSYADIVLVSQGGAPKDLNLYQTQKALDNAKHAVRKGGIIILVGSCQEGLGEDTFEEWILGAEKPEHLISRIESEFKLGGHKAAAIAMVLKNADIYLVSDMEPSLVRKIFMEPFSSIQEALDAAIGKLGKDSKILIMPYGGSILPQVSNNEQ